jgi:hypothetical protein
MFDVLTLGNYGIDHSKFLCVSPCSYKLISPLEIPRALASSSQVIGDKITKCAPTSLAYVSV